MELWKIKPVLETHFSMENVVPHQTMEAEKAENEVCHFHLLQKMGGEKGWRIVTHRHPMVG